MPDINTVHTFFGGANVTLCWLTETGRSRPERFYDVIRPLPWLHVTLFIGGGGRGGRRRGGRFGKDPVGGRDARAAEAGGAGAAGALRPAALSDHGRRPHRPYRRRPQGGVGSTR